jgi:hypothetical protein
MIRLLKRLLSKFTLIPGYCKDCGREMVPVWCTDDEHYRSILSQDDRELCLYCFDRAARKKGEEILWHPIRMRTR